MAPEQSAASKDRGIINIDSDSKCLQSCSIYAPDIYDRIRVAEVCVEDLLSLFAIVTLVKLVQML